MKKLYANFWIRVKHSIQSITEFCSQNLKVMVPEELFSNGWRVSYKVEINLCTNWWKKFRSSRCKCRSTTRICCGNLLFLIYLNIITDKPHENSQIALFAVDCSIFTSHHYNPSPAHEEQIHQISKWLNANKITLNLEKIFYLKFRRKKPARNTLRINEKLLKTKISFKY